MSISTTFRTVIFYLVAGIWALFTVPPLLVCALLPSSSRYDNKVFYFFLRLLYSGLVIALRIPITYKNLAQMPKDPAIFIVNHQSIFDIPLAGMVMKTYPHIWMYKQELDNIPIFGFLTRRMGIAVDRRSARRAARSLVEALHLMRGKMRHIIIFPEGGRFVGGRIHEFLPGFAILAEKTGRPVIPIFLQNTYKVCPPGHTAINYAPVTVTVGPQFLMQADESIEEFTQRVQQWFVQASQEQR